MSNDLSLDIQQDWSVTFQGDSDLHIARREGEIDRVTQILNSLADQPSSDPRAPNKFGEAPLIIACKYGHKESVNKLLVAHDLTTAYERGKNIYILFVKFEMFTVQGGCLEIVNAILNHCPDDRDLHIKSGRCTIHVAVIKGHLDIIS
ncbi:hypothetical protein SUGI_0551440 [Cryptomeria japonica]|nr:hypothetical protein SUGI_0551440 [Cryptomeria japonica]